MQRLEEARDEGGDHEALAAEVDLAVGARPPRAGA